MKEFFHQFILVFTIWTLAAAFWFWLQRPAYAQVPTPLKSYADLTGNGAAQALAGSGSCSQIQFAALRPNGADMRLGDANVSATQGIPLAPGAPDLLTLPMATALSSIYFYAANGDKLSFTCLR